LRHRSLLIQAQDRPPIAAYANRNVTPTAVYLTEPALCQTQACSPAAIKGERRRSAIRDAFDADSVTPLDVYASPTLPDEDRLALGRLHPSFMGKDRIRYRVVDEYNGDTLSEKRARSSKRPLSLGELIDFFLAAWPSTDAGDQTPGGAGKASGATVAPGVPLATAS
jgi:hypothetical protein